MLLLSLSFILHSYVLLDQINMKKNKQIKKKEGWGVVGGWGGGIFSPINPKIQIRKAEGKTK